MTDEPAGGAKRPVQEPLDRSEQGFALLVDSVQDYAIFMLDPHGRVLTWNTGAQRLKGYQPAEIIGRSFEVFYPPDVVTSGWPFEELRRAAEQGRLEDEGWRLRKDGSRFWANVIITALRSPGGALLGFGKVTRDLTERREQEDLLRRSEEQFRLLLQSVADYAIFMLDREGRVLTWNSGAQAIKGYSADEVIGRSFSMFFTAQDIASGTPAKELVTARVQGRTVTEGWRVRRDGSVFWAYVVITPVLDGSGELRGYAKVTRDMSEQRRLADLEVSSRRMREFIAMLAHELRNPLAPVRNAASILKLQADLPPTVRRIGEIVDRQVTHLTRLVDDLLDVGRIVTGKIVLKREPIDFRDVVQLSLEAVRPLVDARGHRLLLDMSDAPLPMTGDATRLAQALQNLLQNAVRYTPDGGEIRVAVKVEGAAVVTTVSDTGIGIAAGSLERIFELFVQEGTQRAPAESGLGIGLSLARRLIELHGGRLSAHSAGLGRGSSFTTLLPWQGQASTDTPAAVLAGTDKAAALRVLVVDDNVDSADTMVVLLEMLGHQARAAYGARQAETAAREFAPEVVLLDLNMPDGDGFSAMKQLRAQSARPLFIGAMTGYGQRDDIEMTRSAGFQAHLVKPLVTEQVLELLSEARRWLAIMSA